MKLIPLLSSGLIVLSPIVFSQSAFADGWPTSVVGNWSVNANNTTGTLSITSQATTGNCRSITGSIFGNPITKGFYCPFSGRIHFFRDSNTGDAFQAYSANLSQDVTTLRMGGLYSDFGKPGEYSFFGSK